MTDEACYWNNYTDGDQDGLGDFCEKNLAAAFAPELYYYSGDNVKREPRWAARVSDDQFVYIAYMLSYYRDEGSLGVWACQFPLWAHECNGHNGDSEMILLTVDYNTNTKHWVLHSARYSAHTGYIAYFRGSSAYPNALHYPERAGGYPRAFVAQGKHANYASVSECNSGAIANTDTCVDVNTAARVAAAEQLNIGSRAVKFIDCVGTSNPLHPDYPNTGQECYWTDTAFLGWYAQSAGDLPAAYGVRLSAWGF